MCVPVQRRRQKARQPASEADLVSLDTTLLCATYILCYCEANPKARRVVVHGSKPSTVTVGTVPEAPDTQAALAKLRFPPETVRIRRGSDGSNDIYSKGSTCSIRTRRPLVEAFLVVSNMASTQTEVYL